MPMRVMPMWLPKRYAPPGGIGITESRTRPGTVISEAEIRHHRRNAAIQEARDAGAEDIRRADERARKMQRKFDKNPSDANRQALARAREDGQKARRVAAGRVAKAIKKYR